MRKIIFVFICSLVLHACSKKEIAYDVFEVAQKNLVKKVEANGSVDSLNTVDVFSPVPGRLQKFFVQEGDRVSAGQKIGMMSSENRSVIIDIAAAKGKEEVEYWKNQLQLTPIFAPVSGKVIVLKAMNTGERISGSIAQISTGDVIRANVDENDLLSIQLGKKVDIRFDIDSKASLPGKVEKISQISKFVNNVNVYEVEVSLPPEDQRKKVPFDIKIGMSVTLFFSVNEKQNALCIPVGAVSGKSLTNVTLLKLDGKKTKVKLGDIYDDYVEVLSGLEMGDKVKVPAFNTGKSKIKKSPFLMQKKE